MSTKPRLRPVRQIKAKTIRQLIEVARLALKGAIIESHINRMDHCGWDEVEPQMSSLARRALKGVK